MMKKFRPGYPMGKDVPRERKIIFWLLLALATLLFFAAPMHAQTRLKADNYPQWNTDKAAAISAAIADAKAVGVGGVVLPCGLFVLNNPVNDTNAPGVQIEGCSANQSYSTILPGQDFGTNMTAFICNTGAFCWDGIGSGRMAVKNFGLIMPNKIANKIQYTAPNPSTVGFAWGRDNATSGTGWTTGTGTYCFPQTNRMENVWVLADTDPTRTAVGTVAIYIVGAEQFNLLEGGYYADAPLFFSATNDLSLNSTFQTILTGCPASMTQMTIGHGVTLASWTRPAIDGRAGINIFTFPGTELLNLNIGTNHSPCVILNGAAATDIYLNGQCEGFDSTLNVNTNVDHLTAEMTAVNPTAGLLTINGNTISSSRINIAQRNGTPQPLINAATAPSSAIKISHIFEGGLSGTGTASNVTVTGSDVYSDNQGDANVNTFNAASQFKMYNTDGISMVHDGIVSVDPRTFRLASTYTNSTTSLSNVTGFAFPVVANKTYHVTCQLYYQAAATGGLQVAFTGPASPTGVHIGATIQTNTTNAQTTGVATALATKVPSTGVAVGTAATDFMATVEATLRNGANAGTLQLQAASVAAVALTIETDSECILH